MEFVSLKDMALEDRTLLLKELGFDTDGTYVLDSKGKRVKDRYVPNLEVKITNMAIMPGSTIILDDNLLSIISYLNEFNVVL